MKKIIAILLLICLVAGCIGCGKKPNEQPSTQPSVDTQPSEPTMETEAELTVTQQPMIAVSVPAVTESTLADDGAVLFNYTYQNMNLILQEPEVADKVIIDFLNRVDATGESASSILSAAKSAYSAQANWIPYICNITYSPTRIDHGVLSLFGTLVTYSGASHPERSCTAASYDLLTGDVLTLASIMSTQATADDFCKLTVEALKEIADAMYLYPGYEETVAQRFNSDLTLDESWFFTQRGLCFFFAPYEIAPYSSGIITIEIPYEKLTGLIYDGYFPAERDTASGTAVMEAFETDKMAQYTQICETTLQRGSDKMVISTQGHLQDLRLTVATDEFGTEVYTAFAAYCLTPGDAIVIEGTQEQLGKAKLTYQSDGQSVTEAIISE